MTTFETTLAIVTAIVELLIALTGLYFYRNHKDAIEMLKTEEGVDISSKDFVRFNLRGAPYGIVIGVSLAFLLMIGISTLAAFAGLIDWGDSTSAGDILIIYFGFLLFGILLPWGVYVELSLTRSYVSEKGVWNISGLARPFVIRWEEIDAVLPSKYPTQDKWFVVKSRSGSARLSARSGLAYFASQLVTNVPGEKWEKSASSLGVSPGLASIPLSDRRHLIEPITRGESDEIVSRMQRAEFAGKAIVIASIFIFTSAGVMLWAEYDMAADPSYGGLETLEDWISWTIALLPNVSAVFMLVYAFLRQQARLFLFAAMLSGFSFLGPLSVIGQILIWRAYKDGAIPWGPRG